MMFICPLLSDLLQTFLGDDLTHLLLLVGHLTGEDLILELHLRRVMDLGL